MRICHKNHVLRGNSLTFSSFCHKKRSQRGRNRLPPAFCHKKGTLCGDLPFRLCRRQGCVRDSRFRRAASVLDVPFAAELAILAACASKSLTQSSQFASRTGASASSGYLALLKVSPVRIPACYGEPENVRLQAFAFSAKITALAFSRKTYFIEGLPSNIRSLTSKV